MRQREIPALLRRSSAKAHTKMLLLTFSFAPQCLRDGSLGWELSFLHCKASAAALNHVNQL